MGDNVLGPKGAQFGNTKGATRQPHEIAVT